MDIGHYKMNEIKRTATFSREVISFLTLLCLAVVSWMSLWFFYTYLDIEYPTSDPKMYWDGSTLLVNGFTADPASIFSSHHRDHVPGYPILIAIVRAMTGWDNPDLMRVMTLVGWTANLLVIYKILTLLQVHFAVRLWGTLLYGVFPLAGMSLAVHPISDTFALLFLVSGILFYLLDRKLLMVLTLAAALLMHKFTWPGVLIIIGVGIWKRRVGWPVAILILSPLLVYWIAISAHYNDPLYLIGGNVNVGLENDRRFPILDGVLQTLTEGLKGSFPDLVKAGMSITILAVALWLTATKSWTQEPSLLAFIVPIVLFGLVTSPYLVFVLVRFGKLLVVPTLFYLSQQRKPDKYVTLLLPFLVILSFLSQFAFTYYLMDFYG